MTKRFIYFFLITVIAVSAYSQSLANKNDIENFIDDQLLSKDSGSEWIIKIDDYVVTRKEFEEGFNYAMSQIPEEQKEMIPNVKALKQNYLETLIAQYVLTIESLNEGIFKDKEQQIFFKAAMLNSIQQIYILENVPENLDSFKPTQQEINYYYEQNKAQLSQLPYNAQQINQMIAQQLTQQKTQEWTQRLLTRTKEKYRIQRNREVMKDLDIE